ncbi:ABC transporter permease subunit [Glycomyces albus]
MSTLAPAMAAEWVKLRTMRPTWWVLFGFAAVAIGLGYLVGETIGRPVEGDEGSFDPLMVPFFGLLTAQMLLIAFAVAAVGGEYSHGTIRPSLTAVPGRGRFYVAKMAVVGLLAAAAALVVEVATYAVAQWRLGEWAADFDGEAVETLLGGWIHLTLLSLFTAGIAAMLRSAVVTLSVLLPVLFLSSQGLGNLPAIKPVAQYLPDQVGMVVMHMTQPGDERFGRDYGAWTGIGILVLWTAASLIGGWIVMRRRDA